MGVGRRHSWRRFLCALLPGVLALAVLAVPGVGALLGVVDADGVAGVVPSGVAVVAVVDTPGCCRWDRAVDDAGGEAVAGFATVYGVSDVADAAGGWCGSVCGRSVACLWGWAAFVPGGALAGSFGSNRDGVQ